jgi:hypothetical protein
MTKTKMTLTNALEMIDALTARVETLEAQLNKPRARARDAIKSERPMTEGDAKRLFTELKQLNHADAARKLGLSYGQVYSARKGFTFKGIYAKYAK